MPTSRLAPHPNNYSIGRGELYFDRFDDSGLKTGELHLGNCSACGITPSYTTKEHYTSLFGIKELDLAIDMEKKYAIKFTLEEYSNENIMMAVRGPLANWNLPQYLNQTGGTATNQAFTARQNRYVDLGKRSINQGTVVLKNSASTTMTEGYDYTIDYMTGRVFITYNGRVYDNEACTITFTYNTIKYPLIITSDDTQVRGYMRFISKQSQGPQYEVEMWIVKIRCTSEIGLITDDWGKLQFEGEIFRDAANHQSQPYFRFLERRATTIIS